MLSMQICCHMSTSQNQKSQSVRKATFTCVASLIGDIRSPALHVKTRPGNCQCPHYHDPCSHHRSAFPIFNNMHVCH